MLVETVRSTLGQRVPATLGVVIAATVCGGVLATVGQASAASRHLLGVVDDAGTREVVVTDVDGRAELEPDAVDRVASISAAAWSIGFGPAVDGVDPRVPGEGFRVASRTVVGALPRSRLSAVVGRLPGPGEAFAGVDASRALGLESSVGVLSRTTDLKSFPIVGSAVFLAPLEFLNDSVIINDGPAPVTLLVASASDSTNVAQLELGVEEVLAPLEPRSLRIVTSAELARLRADVKAALEASGFRLVLAALGVGLVLSAVNAYAAVAMRRRDFGRRRALGAT